MAKDIIFLKISKLQKYIYNALLELTFIMSEFYTGLI